MKPDAVYAQRRYPILRTVFNRRHGQLTKAPSEARLACAIGTKPSRLAATLLIPFVFALLNGCSAAGAPSFALFGAFFPAWLFCGLIGLLAGGVARGFFVGTGLSDLIPYQLFVCVAIGVIAACLAWLLWFGW
jgi:hypothetical protein